MRLPDGFSCGHWTDAAGGTGCTVLMAPPGSVGAGEVRGGGPGTRESDLLSPLTSTPGPEAILLTGGSAFGLAAADGVVAWLAQRGRGFQTPAGRVPLVSAAVIYDLAFAPAPRPPVEPRGPGPHQLDCGSRLGGNAALPAAPDATAGRAACDAAGPTVERGAVGAGTGATAGNVLGAEHATRTGLGAASLAAGAATVVAVAVANPIGDVLAADGSVLAGVRGHGRSVDLLAAGSQTRLDRTNTTLVVACTDARLTKLEAHLVARAMTAGVARAVSPAATAFDGDLTACLASGAVDADPQLVAVVAAEATSAAIRDAARGADRS